MSNSRTLTPAQIGESFTQKTDRLLWMDAARGLGIILVVYAHGARALFDVLPHIEMFRQLDGAIYSFHMPFFFFIAGLVSPRSLERSKTKFIKSKLVAVVYPYVLWSAVYWGLELLFAARVNSPLDPDAIMHIGWIPIEHLWFLYVLFICQCLAALVWPRVFLLVGLSLWCFFGFLPEITVPALWVQLPWFTAGLLLASTGMRPSQGPVRQAAISLIFAAFFGLGVLMTSSIPAFERLTNFLTAGVGITLTIGLGTAISSNRVIRYLGEASLSIYLLHTIFSAGAREILEILLPVNGLAMLALTVLAGLFFPLVVHEIARRSGLAPFLGLGKMSSGSRRDHRGGPATAA